MGGWIKLHRKLLDSSITSNPNTLSVWIHFLLKASHKEHEQIVGNQNILLLPGQFVFGRKKFSKETGISENIIRSSLLVLQQCRNITIKTTNKFSVVTLTNWGLYQNGDNNSPADSPANHQQTTSKPPADNQQTTTNNKGKKEKNVKNNTEWVSPGGLNVNAWSEFEQHRKDIRKPMSNLAKTKAANQICSLSQEQQQATIDNSIQSGWAGLFPDKIQPHHKTSSKVSSIEEHNRALKEELFGPDNASTIEGEFYEQR